MISEKSARNLSKYVNKLVRRQPYWLRKLFEEDNICFSCEEDGTLCLAVSENLPVATKRNARRLIARYMETHPCTTLEEKVFE